MVLLGDDIKKDDLSDLVNNAWGKDSSREHAWGENSIYISVAPGKRELQSEDQIPIALNRSFDCVEGTFTSQLLTWHKANSQAQGTTHFPKMLQIWNLRLKQWQLGGGRSSLFEGSFHLAIRHPWKVSYLQRPITYLKWLLKHEILQETAKPNGA